MAEVVTLNPPKGDPELVETLRSMLSEAQNGRLKSYVAVFTTGDGRVGDSHFFATVVDEMVLGSFFKEVAEE